MKKVVLIIALLSASYIFFRLYQPHEVVIPFETSKGMTGGISAITVENITKDNVVIFLVTAGGTNPIEYKDISNQLNAKRIHIIGHSNLDTGLNFIVHTIKRVMSAVDSFYLFHDQFSQPFIRHGSQIFWETHDEAYKSAIKYFLTDGALNGDEDFVYIGHSHGSSIVAIEYLSKLTKKSPSIVYITPCFNPNSTPASNFETLLIKAELDTDECSIAPYNYKFINGDAEAIEITGMDHYSFISRSLFHQGSSFLELRESLMNFFPNNNELHTEQISNEINSFITKSKINVLKRDPP